MAPDLPEKLLGIDIDPVTDREDSARTSADEDAEDRERFVVFTVGDNRLAVPIDDVVSITDLPDEVTDVPRTPDAIEGVTDLRGEITAVIDPRVYFPTAADRNEYEQLLVFDSPDDQQSAALRIDDVISVESIPESDVLSADDLESRPVSGDALEHPLVESLIERTRRQRGSIELADRTAPADGETPADGPDPTVAADAGEQREVLEVVPVIELDALLSASSYRVSTADAAT
ncbi:chemotaxis protein CheW [Halopiger goleimassiliensis]|uniref:chemotaxis protein CheW n=1 Tax=Halopiger goleimassiliensis TaxID=1293048 RepID=UPI000677E93A|nr:chemotaxis protein CheW [Halopiger goleimassiliensis]